MPSHFEDLGFETDTDEDINTLLKWTLMYGKKILINDNMDYYQWKTGKDIELWVGLEWSRSEQSGPLFRNYCITPFFSAKTINKVQITGENKDNQCDFCRGYEAKLLESTEPLLPITFEVPNFQLSRKFVNPGDEVFVELVAYAEEVKYFETEQEFFENQFKIKEIPRSIDYYIPIGSLMLESEINHRNNARGLLVGRILESVELYNPVTDLGFYYLLTRCMIGDISITVDRDVFDVKPKPGGLIEGSFYFNGKIIF